MVQGKVEDVEDGAIPMVDVIISDWMGHALFHESLISSVLAARDRWLVQDGLMLPDKAINIIFMDVWIHMEAVRKYPFIFKLLSFLSFQATLHLAATNLRVAESKEWWGNVHGFDMGTVSVASLKEVEIGKLKESDLVTAPCLLAEFSLYNCKR